MKNFNKIFPDLAIKRNIEINLSKLSNVILNKITGNLFLALNYRVSQCKMTSAIMITVQVGLSYIRKHSWWLACSQMSTICEKKMFLTIFVKKSFFFRVNFFLTAIFLQKLQKKVKVGMSLGKVKKFGIGCCIPHRVAVDNARILQG